MRKTITLMLQALVLLGLAFNISCTWSVCPLNPQYETDPFGAMIGLYFWGFPFLIIIGLLLLAGKKVLRTSWIAGALPVLYAAPYSLELILKEHRWIPYTFHRWWELHVYPWTGTFLRITLVMLALYAIVFIAEIVVIFTRRKPEPAR